MLARVPTFWLKLVLAVAVVATGDFLFFEGPEVFGLNVAMLLGSATVALVLAGGGIWRSRLAVLALAAASAFALIQVERPTFSGFVLWCLAMGVAALAPRAPVGEDGWRWSQRLVVGGFRALIGPVLDLRDVLRARARTGPLKLTAILLAAILPVAGGLLFLQLFAVANPLIGRAFAGLSLPEFAPARLIFWMLVGLPVWAVLRPRGLRRTFQTPGIEGDLKLPGVTTASVTVSLMVFNAVFALQNGLDIAYLWSGAGLPQGITFADYAHRGAYPLVATALLAGLFVVVFLRPGSQTAAQPFVRWLVVGWVAQNVFLVASTALRTIDYIDAYSLTRMRIAALIWMGLVAIGLLLILWRLLRAKSSSWLINANLLAVGAVLSVCSVIDLGSIAATWNVRHTRDVGGRGVELDACYLQTLRGAALVPLAEIERQPLSPRTQAKVAITRYLIQREVEDSQKTWRGWRFRDARRLARINAVLGDEAKPIPPGFTDNCRATPLTAPPLAPATPPLTQPENPRT